MAKIPARFTNEESARKHLEGVRWPEGPVCPHCGTIDRASRIEGGRKGLLFCNACREQFTVTVGTVFERSKIPLHTWLYANHLLCSSKKGMSAHQLHRMLGVTYKTAWFMFHRLRAAMDPMYVKPPNRDLGGPGKILEMDETYIGKKAGKKMKHAFHKNTVFSLVERGGEVRSFHVDHASKPLLSKIVSENVRRETRHYTDGAAFYQSNAMGLDGGHDWVDHGHGEYMRGTVHTNTIEGFFSIFKRGMKGVYQHCGEQHLHRYLAEFDFRYNNRIALGIDDAVRADRALAGIEGKRLTYRRIEEAPNAPPAD